MKKQGLISINARKEILQQIFGEFQQITQSLSANFNTNTNISKAESLIEFLEIDDCGSIGGYDQNNQIKRLTGFKLYDRFLCLLVKYRNERDLKPICYFTPQSLGVYFKSVIELREQFNTEDTLNLELS